MRMLLDPIAEAEPGAKMINKSTATRLGGKGELASHTDQGLDLSEANIRTLNPIGEERGLCQMYLGSTTTRLRFSSTQRRWHSTTDRSYVSP